MKRMLLILMVLTMFVVTSENKGSSPPLKVQTMNKPNFILLNSTLTEIQSEIGIYQFNATIHNNGSAPATTGTVPFSWESVVYGTPMSAGTGTLNESSLNLDLNGDGDITDTFLVQWFHNETRQTDALIDGVHVYSQWEGPPDDPYQNRTYFINGQSKLFQLGNKTHILYYVTEEAVFLGLDAFILEHPGPNFHIGCNFNDVDVAQNFTVTDFRINNNPVKQNYSIIYRKNVLDFGIPIFDSVSYIFPNQPTEISVGEIVTISFIIKADSTLLATLWYEINWSLDGNKRDSWMLEEIEAIPFVVNTTTTTTTFLTTTSRPVGSSFITLILVLISFTFLIHRRRRFWK
jgi:hypothetical protein